MRGASVRARVSGLLLFRFLAVGLIVLASFGGFGPTDTQPLPHWRASPVYLVGAGMDGLVPVHVAGEVADEGVGVHQAVREPVAAIDAADALFRVAQGPGPAGRLGQWLPDRPPRAI